MNKEATQRELASEKWVFTAGGLGHNNEQIATAAALEVSRKLDLVIIQLHVISRKLDNPVSIRRNTAKRRKPQRRKTT